jgi:calreticulin
MIPNPAYKGEQDSLLSHTRTFRASRGSPVYRPCTGEWVHPQIDNPAYEANPNLYSYDSFGAIGFDLWQVKSGTIFDNVLITDDIAVAESAVTDFKERVKGEKAMKEAEDKKKKEEEEAAKVCHRSPLPL